MKNLATLPIIFILSFLLAFSPGSIAQEPTLEAETVQPSNENKLKPEEKSSNPHSKTLNSQDFRLGRSPEESRSQAPNPTVGLAKATGSLAIILAVIFAIYYVLRKFSKQIGIQAKDNPIRVHSKQMLDAKTSLYLIRVYEDEFLISVGPNGTSNIARYALIGEDGKEENIPNAPEFRQFMGETVGEDIKPAGVEDNA